MFEKFGTNQSAFGTCILYIVSRDKKWNIWKRTVYDIIYIVKNFPSPKYSSIRYYIQFNPRNGRFKCTICMYIHEARQISQQNCIIRICIYILLYKNYIAFYTALSIALLQSFRQCFGLDRLRRNFSPIVAIQHRN